MTRLGALTIRIGFWCPLYYENNKEPPKKYRQLSRPLYYGLEVFGRCGFGAFFSGALLASALGLAKTGFRAGVGT